MASKKPAVNRDKVEELKQKAQGFKTESGNTSQTVLYGSHTENESAAGNGEYDS